MDTKQATYLDYPRIIAHFKNTPARKSAGHYTKNGEGRETEKKKTKRERPVVQKGRRNQNEAYVRKEFKLLQGKWKKSRPDPL